MGPFKIGGSSSHALVTVDIRLIDATTGEVLQSHNASGRVPSSDVTLGVTQGAIDVNTDRFKSAPIGQATRQAIHEAVKFIIQSMEKVPFTAKVAKVNGGDIYINAGSSMNIKVGDKFQLYAVGESITDPDTGLSLGSKDKRIGTVEVKEVEDKFSIGAARASITPKPGDVLKVK